MTNLSLEAYSMDPDQTALYEQSDLGPGVLKHFSRRQKQTTFVVIADLMINFQNLLSYS